MLYLDNEFDLLITAMKTSKDEIDTALTDEISGGSCDIDSVDRFEECMDKLQTVLTEYKELVGYDITMIEGVLFSLRATDAKNEELTVGAVSELRV